MNDSKKLSNVMWLVCEEYIDYGHGGFDDGVYKVDDICLWPTEQEAKDFIDEYQETFENRLIGPFKICIGKPEGLKKKYFAYLNKHSEEWTDADNIVELKWVIGESEVSRDEAIKNALLQLELYKEKKALEKEEKIKNTKETYLTVVDIERNEIVHREKLPAENLPKDFNYKITRPFENPKSWHVRALTQEQADRIAAMLCV